MGKLSKLNFLLLTAILLGFLLPGFPVRGEADGFVPLFDGKTLRGWHTQPGGKWEVRDGVILGTSERKESRHGLLVTDKPYRDFTARFSFKVVKGNSGFYFRSEKTNSRVGIKGIQAEVDNSEQVSGLYETGGRNWVKKPPAGVIARLYKPGEWNDMSVTAIGRDITVTLNGTETLSIKNDPGRLEGHFALQLHGGQDMEVLFKNIMIREEEPAPLDADAGFIPMFNGKDLTGWHTTGNWVVEDRHTLALIPRPGEHGWTRYSDYLATDRKYGNFVLDLEFKFDPGGNSGVFLRVGDLKDHVNSGFEIQILDTHGKKKVGPHDCGGVINTAAPSSNRVKPAGEWNRYLITLLDSSLKVILNGEPIIDLDISQSKIKDRPARGYISFQDEGKPVWYRNVRIKELH